MKSSQLLSHKNRLFVSACLWGVCFNSQASVVGDGSPESCTQSILKAAIKADGNIKFNCGNEPHIIYITEEIEINEDLIIDGAGLISLDGRNKNRIFKTLGDREPNMNIEFHHITFQYGYNFNEGGGAIQFGSRTDLLLDDVTFYKNEAYRDRPQCDGGGGAFFLGYASTAIIKNSLFKQNKANNGGAMAHLHSDLDVSDTIFEGNQAYRFNSSSYDNCSGGGAIYMDGARRDYDGGQRELKFQRVQFINNEVDHLGGALYSHIYNDDNTLVEDCLFIGNKAYGNWGGGAIWHNRADGTGRMYLNNSLITDNYAHTSGGGIYADGPITMQNVTLYKNTAFNPDIPENDYHRGTGGAINLGDGGETKILNSTIVDNVAGYIAGGIIGGYDGDYSSRPFIANTIISNNTSMRPDARQSCNQPMADGGGNIQYPEGSKYRCFEDALVQDPRLDVLANDGGLYSVLALLADSPAINYANPSYCPDTDQRGANRGDSQCDSGAYEYGESLDFDYNITAIIYDLQSGIRPTNTRFNYRISTDTGLNGTGLNASITDSLNISIDINLAATDIGQTGQLFVFATIPDGSYKMQNAQGQWLDWDLDPLHLSYVTDMYILDANISWDILKKTAIPFKGQYQVWMGYRLNNNVFTLPLSNPIKFSIN